jgi:Phage integrase, N-terminal SAM-like domain
MTKPISPLRQRMIDDMTMRNLSANTQETYIRSVAQFSAFHRPSSGSSMCGIFTCILYPAAWWPTPSP